MKFSKTLRKLLSCFKQPICLCNDREAQQIFTIVHTFQIFSNHENFMATSMKHFHQILLHMKLKHKLRGRKDV